MTLTPMPQQPKHLSFSALKTLTGCGMRYWLERGLGWKGDPGWAMAGGSGVHTATEMLDKELLSKGSLDFPDNETAVAVAWAWELAFEQEIVKLEEKTGVHRSDFRASGRKSNAWPDKEDVRWWNHHGPIYVASWLRFIETSPWNIAILNGEPAIEVEITVPVGGIDNKMFIDRVMETPDGDLVVVDIKTGARAQPGSWQLGEYAHGLTLMLGEPVKYGCYWDARKDQTSVVFDLSYWTPELLDDVHAKGKAIIEQGLFLPNQQDHCSWCSVKKACPAFGNDPFAPQEGEADE